MDRGSKYPICNTQMVVRCEMRKYDLEDDIGNAIYIGWKEVVRVCYSSEMVVGISRNLMKYTISVLVVQLEWRFVINHIQGH